MLFATTLAVAMPAAFDPAMTGEAILGPDAGPENTILTLATGLPTASTIFATSGAANAVPKAAAWLLPETIWTAAGGAGSIVSVNDPLADFTGVLESVTVKLTVLVPTAAVAPEITPVVAFTDNPVGNPVADHV